MPAEMKLALRDRLAEICLAAVADPAAEAPLVALLAFARGADASGLARGLADRDRTLLLEGASPFEASDGGLRLRSDLPGEDLAALKQRAERFAEVVAACRSRCGVAPAPRGAGAARAGRFAGGPPDAREVDWVLCVASALFNAQLFFEVHEILEPYWGRAEGALQSFLQGLIQVAVGFYHRANGNWRGAFALLGEGNAKLAPFLPEAHGVDLADFCRAVAEIVSQPMGGKDCGNVPPKLVFRAAQGSEIRR
jgi:Domain of unknown function (DUF309)